MLHGWNMEKINERPVRFNFTPLAICGPMSIHRNRFVLIDGRNWTCFTSAVVDIDRTPERESYEKIMHRSSWNFEEVRGTAPSARNREKGKFHNILKRCLLPVAFEQRKRPLHMR